MTESNGKRSKIFNIKNMHPISELSTNVPAFLGKLWKLVEDSETDDLICWAPNGRSFFIRNQAQFARDLLPHYYKHNNMASFVRQLNMYGFHKKVSVELGGLKCDRDEMEFAHQYFLKGHPYLLDHIKRKIATAKILDPSITSVKPELMTKMLTEVRSMRGKQDHLDSRLENMKRENEALWRELAVLRQKHLKQQQIVNKLIHFLVTIVQPSRGGGLSVKRRYPLMIDDYNRQRSKQSKMSKAQTSPLGPVIHELDISEHDLDSEYIVAEMLENQQNPTVQSPEHQAQPVADEDNSEVLHFCDSVQIPENIQCVPQKESDGRKRRAKGKKKRKSTVPIKISIPSTESGEECREETIMVEVPQEEEPIPIFESNSPTTPKPVPLATVRSSKLAAMAANLNKDVEQELDPDLCSGDLDEIDEIDEIEEEVRNNPEMVKLENILIIPEILSDDNAESGENRMASSTSSLSDHSKNINSPNSVQSLDFEENAAREQEQFNFAGSSNNGNSEADKNKEPTGASTSASTDNLSLSRFNSSGLADDAYRDEVDNHLETMQSELENLREILRGEGYSIDANTLLGAGNIMIQPKNEELFLIQNKAHDLFGNEDPMSFGIPMNPELDPHSNKGDKDEGETNDGSNGNNGELMAYNPIPTLMDFDDDMFLSAAISPATNSATDIRPTGAFSSDPLELGDSKNSILDSLIAANNDQDSNT
ncbi:heat shock factor protein-like isoform X2 [Belonocnema kinseyi]|uniref:heat shock factor protein-like isoform X2 n=1 Tax=Belonocnema kinseyi TaxID=2817044 RepID=UPI00143D697E|nr:heat shock factor protein-like isoform X2 [Belonocnema kinseyi]